MKEKQKLTVSQRSMLKRMMADAQKQIKIYKGLYDEDQYVGYLQAADHWRQKKDWVAQYLEEE